MGHFKGDFQIENHMSITLVRPLTKTCRKWLEENTSDEAQWFGGALVVEPRYVENLYHGLDSGGFSRAA
jgi:hypothetical protein